MKVFKTVLLIFLLPILSFSQQSEGGILLGLTSYLGDLTAKSINFKEKNLAYGIFYKHHLNENFALRGSITLGKVTGSDNSFDELKERNFSFESNIFDFGVAAEYSLFKRKGMDAGGTFSPTFSPYVFIGIGFVSFDPKTEGLPSNSPDLTEDYSTFVFSIPIGLGLKYDVSSKVTLGLEASMRPAFSDYLDGISESANPDKKDWFFIGGVTLGYRFGAKNSLNSGS